MKDIMSIKKRLEQKSAINGKGWRCNYVRHAK